MATKKVIHWEKHPSITLVNGKPHLKIFEEYFVESDLPKFQKLYEERKKKLSGKGMTKQAVDEAPVEVGWNVDVDTARWLDTISDHVAGDPLEAADRAASIRRRYVYLRANLSGDGVRRLSPIDSVDKSKSKTRKRKLTGFLKAIVDQVASVAHRTEKENLITIEQVFDLAKKDLTQVTTEDILRSRAIAVGLEKHFRESCQYAMADKIKNQIVTLAPKLLLAQKGYDKYLTEEKVIEFMTSAERGVQVEFLRFYPETIPFEAKKKIVQCNLDLLFDNYVVMYYSKEAQPVHLLTEAIDDGERTRRRDPILFGTINGCRQLFYICDWIYGDDDLTLRTVEKAIGTLPSLNDEKIADSQKKVANVLHDMGAAADETVQEMRKLGLIKSIISEAAPKKKTK